MKRVRESLTRLSGPLVQWNASESEKDTLKLELIRTCIVMTRQKYIRERKRCGEAYELDFWFSSVASQEQISAL